MQTIYAMSFYKFKFIWIQMGCVKVAKVFYYFFRYSELESVAVRLIAYNIW